MNVPNRTSRRGSSVFPSLRTGKRAGFTLIELLVVVLLLAILATLLLPALRHAKMEASAAACRHHLRQWGLGTQLYLAEHDDLLPPEGFPNPTDRTTNSGWYIQLPREMGLPRYHDMPWRTNAGAPLGRVPWICPSNRRRSNGRNLFHYCLNQHVDGTGDMESPVRLASIMAPAQVVWMFDSRNLPALGNWAFTHTNLHRAGAHFLFLDGHTIHRRGIDYWDFKINRARTNVDGLRWVP